MSAATRQLKMLPTPGLGVAWVVLITARVALFNRGDSLGAYVMLVAFWLASAVLAAQAVALLVSGEGGWEHRLILIALAAFFLPPILGRGAASKVCFVVFFLAALSLLVIYTKRLFRQGRHAVEQ